MFKNMFEKALKTEKGQQWSFPDKKLVDKDAICLINIISNLDPIIFFTISDKPRAYMCRCYF